MYRRVPRSMAQAFVPPGRFGLARCGPGPAAARQEPHAGRRRRDDARGEGQPRRSAPACGVPACRRTRRGRPSARRARGVPGAAGTTVRHPAAGDPVDRRRRRPGRPADPAEARGRRLAHVLLHGLPDRDAARLVLGHRPRRARRPRHGQRGQGVRRRRPARARPQHPPQPARRPELRVLLGGPAGLGPDGRRHGEGRAVAGRRARR